MKKITIKFFTILTLAMSFGSCTDFLEVRPKSSFPDYLMFSTPEGFTHAMNGAYLIMRQSVYHPFTYYYGGYNQNATGFFEFMGGGWVQKGNVLQSKDANLYSHNYDHYLLQNDILGYFKGQYKTITNVNLILKWIDDETQDFLSDELYSMVKGEALALKAFILFELIQTYGPSPTSTQLHNYTYLPYPKSLVTGAYERETYTRFMELLWNDIIDAEKLLEKYDPIIEYSVSDLENLGNWRKRRNNKMNYYALMGLKARVQLYTGDKAGALESALVVINAKNPDGTEKFPFMEISKYKPIKTSDNTDPADLIGVCEHMFAFEHDYVGDSWTLSTYMCPQNFTAVTVVKAETFSAPGVYELAHHGLHLKDKFPDAELFENYGVRSQDLRLEKWFARTATGTNMICQKYYPLTQTGHNSALPIMRKGEMLLIAAECEPSLSKAAEYLNTLRKARWIDKVTVGNAYKLKPDGTFILPKEVEYIITLEKPYTPVTFANEEERMNWVIGEYSREFIMEGRTFFTWKRMGLQKLPYPADYYNTDNALSGDINMTDSKYIVPLPESEVYVADY